MTALLTVENLVAGYLNRPVLHDVSFQLQPQSVMAVIGPNGHGKTTLLRALSGLIETRNGKTTFDGVSIEECSAHERVAMGLIHVPQGDQLFTDMSVEENLLMGAYLVTDAGEIKNRLEQAYSFFPALKDRRGQTTSSLSGGERRMVGIGRGLMADAKLLMIDEPSLGLAPLLIEQIYEGLSNLRKADCAFLVVEENPSRLIGVADELCLMDAGRLVWTGSAVEARQSRDILDTYLGGH